MPLSLSPGEALERLISGNKRFVQNVRGAEAVLSQVRRAELAHDQRPIAVVLGCSDSRVPAEIVYDQGLGDLFVIRVAGNIVAPSQLASVEFAVARFGVPLVVVMGHARCGAVDATLEHLQTKEVPAIESIMSIVNRIAPAVQSVIDAGAGKSREVLLRESVRSNVRAAANHLRHGTTFLENRIQQRQLMVVGAEYDLVTGEVDVFDAPLG
ncbi:MAG: carbonic anhydrase [Archangiaceae bacterium]|nr:carbonic anhydrase [Archangiaceae bacterium]